MKDRIKKIMDIEQLTPTRFADKLQINRAVISHILNGRNNPSLDVVTKILSEINYINPEWLITGIGPIYKKGTEPNSIENEPNLFSRNDVNLTDSANNGEKPQEMSLKECDIDDDSIDNEMIKTISNHERKITQIIIYFSDNTFETFIPPKS